MWDISWRRILAAPRRLTAKSHSVEDGRAARSMVREPQTHHPAPWALAGEDGFLQARSARGEILSARMPDAVCPTRHRDAQGPTRATKRSSEWPDPATAVVVERRVAYQRKQTLSFLPDSLARRPIAPVRSPQLSHNSATPSQLLLSRGPRTSVRSVDALACCSFCGGRARNEHGVPSFQADGSSNKTEAATIGRD